MFSNKEEFKQQYAERMIKMYGRSLESAHITEKYLVLGEMVREYARFIMLFVIRRPIRNSILK